MNKSLFISMVVVFLSVILSCEKEGNDENNKEATDTVAHETDDDYEYDSTKIVAIVFNGSSVTINGDGATASGTKVTIAHAGVFSISGSTTNGQIIVNTEDEQTVKLILDSPVITCATSAPINVRNCEKVVINLPDHSTSVLSDGTSYTYDDAAEEEPNATIFSKSDMTIYGSGLLTINAQFKDGISSKDGLIIKNSNVVVTAADNGIRGKDYLIVKQAYLKINSGSNGLKSDNDENASLGYISLESARAAIISAGDGITAVTKVNISGGSYSLTTGGGSSRTVTSAASAKGIKSLVATDITCDSMVINAADDALHSNGSLAIDGGYYSLSSADDGTHADNSLAFNNAEIHILKSYEGVESASITVNNTTLSIESSDDGFNSTAGKAVEMNDNSCLTINSGTITINATGGDALDSNGNNVIAGGIIIAHGPKSQPEVGLDYNGTCRVTGGTLVVSGPSSNMVQAPSTSSSQYSVLIKFTTSFNAHTLVNIAGTNGGILTFSPERAFQTIVFSSSELALNETYTISTGGSSTGTVSNGYYTGGNYTGGTVYKTFTIAGVITTVGSSNSTPGRQ